MSEQNQPKKQIKKQAPTSRTNALLIYYSEENRTLKTQIAQQERTIERLSMEVSKLRKNYRSF